MDFSQNITPYIIEALIYYTIMHRLTDRQSTCAGLAYEGMTQEQIASQLGISQPMVHRHLRNATAKMNGLNIRIREGEINHEARPPDELNDLDPSKIAAMI